MQNSNQVLENKFNNLYFHAKSQIKRKKIKNKVYFHAKSKVKSEKYHKVKFHNHLKAVVMQNPKFYIGSNFDNLYFHAKS